MVGQRHLRNHANTYADTDANAYSDTNADTDTNAYPDANPDTDANRTDKRREGRPDQTRVHRLLPFLER